MKKTLFIFFSIIFSISVKAQVTEAQKAQLIKDWERAKVYTGEYLAVIPADQIDYKPHDSVRSIARQLLHMAQANYGLGASGTGVASPILRNLETTPTAKSRDSTVYFINASYDWVIDGIKKMTLANFDEKSKFFGFEESRYVWLLKAHEHQTHHRGQLTIYIRMLGLKPPQEKLF